MKKLKTYLVLLGLLLISCLKSNGQTLTYQFIDPCTKVVSFFSVPATGTTIFFLNKSAQFTSADVASGAFAAWINQVYADYRKVSPCGVQQGQVTQNQITSQIIGNTVQSVVGSIMSSAQSAASGTISAGGTDAASKGKTESDNKKKDNNGNNSNNNSNGNTSNGSNSAGGNTNGSGTSQSGSNTSGGSNSSGTGNNGSTGTSGGNSNGNNSNGNQQNQTEDKKGEEVGATTTMNIDAQNQKSETGGDNGGGGKGNGKGNGKSGSSNPLIVSSDFTTAQNLDKTFTPILNLSMSQSSMTGMSSWGTTAMIWFNFKQFALSGKYTKINFSKNGKLKWVHNISLTAVYSYGNILGFVGYSGILNAGKWGVTGFNTSAAATLMTEDKNTFISPSITAFYTRPFKSGKRLTISPELYVMSTPLIYSTKEKVTTSDRTFSAFVGSGFDYQITKRFKMNMNYKANLSTNPDFPILSFFLIGSKVNL